MESNEKTAAAIVVVTTSEKFLGQFPPRIIAPNPKLTLSQTLTLIREGVGVIFLWGNCLVAPNPKTNPGVE